MKRLSPEIMEQKREKILSGRDKVRVKLSKGYSHPYHSKGKEVLGWQIFPKRRGPNSSPNIIRVLIDGQVSLMSWAVEFWEPVP